jgi:hypothetical protein
MATAGEILNSEEYTNYRNVRAASLLFVLLGTMLALVGGMSLATGKAPNPNDPPALVIGAGNVGLAGAVGGMAALRGSRRWAKLAYVMAVPWLLGFPLGTILSWVVLSGLSRYLASKQRICEATVERA